MIAQIENYNKKISEELKEIENAAIIECMLAEIDVLEKKLEATIMMNQRVCRMLGGPDCGKEHYSRYKIAMMDATVNAERIKTKVQAFISPLRIVPLIVSFMMGGGGKTLIFSLIL